MKRKESITIELRYTYTIDVDVSVDDDGDIDDGDYDEAKDAAFELACVAHAKATEQETAAYNLSDSWQAYDENGEAI